MRYILAFFLPWLSLMLQGKVFSGIICLVLCITLIGWLPAFIWAAMSLNRMYDDRRTNAILTAMTGKNTNFKS